VNVVTSSATRAGTSRARSLRRRWTREEDAKLMDAVTKFGYNWIRIATLIPGRTNINCRQRWTKNLNPTKEHPTGKWTAVDDARLIVAVKEHGGSNWAAVALLVPGRIDIQCRSRWVNTLDPTIDRLTGKWTLEEDAKLTEAVKKFGNSDWVAAAELIPGRTNKQCRQRWIKHLDPGINRGEWTVEEDAKLTDAVKEHGRCRNWAAVASLVPGRTDKQCLSRWDTNLDPDASKGKWAVEEDAKLIVAVNELGKSWVRVAAQVPGRTDLQCRSRYGVLNNC
jgi:myb proto-oncogene protein